MRDAIIIGVASVIIGIGGGLAFVTMRPASSQPSQTQHCIDRVMYVQFNGGATVKYRPDGKIWTCGGS